jgi:hypothetical protein
MKHAEKLELLNRIKRDIAYAEAQRDQSHQTAAHIELPRVPKDGPDKMTKADLAALGKAKAEQEWQRGAGTAWASIRERLLSLQRFVVDQPIDDLDTILGNSPKKAAKKAQPRKAKSRKR